MAKSKLFPTRNDLPENVREKMVTLLNQQLVDTIDLQSQTKQAHWNVKGIHFHQLHELFDELAAELTPFIDEIAERATALGGLTTGTVRQSASASRIPEYPADITEGRKHLEALSERYGALANSTRAAIDVADEAGDADTADLFTEVSRTLDKQLWFLESHLQG